LEPGKELALVLDAVRVQAEVLGPEKVPGVQAPVLGLE